MDSLWPLVRGGIIYPLIFIYGLIPLLLFFFPSIHNQFVFLSIAKWPFTNYEDLSGLGVEYRGRNFFLQSLDPEIKLGVWQILPKSLSEAFVDRELTETDYEEALSHGTHPIVVYLHGNSWTRSAAHRIALYNLLAEAEYHIVALDYRGFGDSSGTPTQEGVVRDALAIYKWVHRFASHNPVFIWGHSLGTGIGALATRALCDEDLCPTGLVLEAPFNNLRDIIHNHHFTTFHRWLPFFEYLVVKPCHDQGLHLPSDDAMAGVQCPMLMLHAHDDGIVPFHLADALHQTAVGLGRDVKLIHFTADRNYGHKFIHKAPELPDIIYEFFQKCISEKDS